MAGRPRGTRTDKPLRQHHLDRADRGTAAADNREWRLVRPWPAALRFEDGPTERLVDRLPLPAPVIPGTYTCTAGIAAESRFAEEGEIDERLRGGSRP